MSFFNSFEAVIFDLDGTLIDSMHIWEHFCGDWLRSLGKIPEESLEADIAPLSVAQSADYLNRCYGLNLSREELAARWEDAAIPRYLKGAPLKQGAGELVRALARKQMPLGIATYSLPRACRAVLSHHGILEYFSGFLYAHEFEDFSSFSSVKKDPAFWRTAAALLDRAPEKCVVFEDSFSSLEGARAAGMKVVGVYDASASKWPLLREAADLAVNYPGEALKFLSD